MAKNPGKASSSDTNQLFAIVCPTANKIKGEYHERYKIIHSQQLRQIKGRKFECCHIVLDPGHFGCRE